MQIGKPGDAVGTSVGRIRTVETRAEGDG